MTTRSRTIATTAAALGVVVLVTGCRLDTAAGSGEQPGMPEDKPGVHPDVANVTTESVQSARESLATLQVAAPRHQEGYDRDEFGSGWSTSDGCSTREEILTVQGYNVRVDDDCSPIAGTWVGGYTGETIHDPSEIDIEHGVPLADAWSSGAWRWSEARRREFANDWSHLLVTTQEANRSRGDAGPSAWMPPQAEARCYHATTYAITKDLYALSITPADKQALAATLDDCPVGS